MSTDLWSKGLKVYPQFDPMIMHFESRQSTMRVPQKDIFLNKAFLLSFMYSELKYWKPISRNGECTKVVYNCGFWLSYFPQFSSIFPHFFLNLKIRTTFSNSLKHLKQHRYIIQLLHHHHMIYL